MTPGQAIRQQCIACVQSAHEVRACGGDHMIDQGDANNACYFWPYRLGKGRPSVKVIRKFCLECMGGNRAFVADCTTTQCPVHPFRFGRNPNMAAHGYAKRSQGIASRAFCDEKQAITKKARR